MSDSDSIAQYRGAKVVDRDGNKIGTVDEIYLDQETDRPEWALVNTGVFGTRSSFVPLAEAEWRDGDLVVPYEKDQVKDAPSIKPDEELSQDQEAELYDYYGLAYSQEGSDSGLGQDAAERDVLGRDERAGGTDVLEAGGPTSDRATIRSDEESDDGRDTSGQTSDRATTRSDEEADVGKSRRDVGRPRLRKHVVTEDVTVTVPVRQEVVTVEGEPLADDNRDEALVGPAVSEEDEVTLFEEQIEVTKRVVPKERVRLDRSVVTEQREIHKEQIKLDSDEQRA